MDDYEQPTLKQLFEKRPYLFLLPIGLLFTIFYTFSAQTKALTIHSIPSNPIEAKKGQPVGAYGGCCPRLTCLWSQFY